MSRPCPSTKQKEKILFPSLFSSKPIRTQSNMSYTLPPLSSLNSLSDSQQTELLNNLFEPHSTIVNYLKPIFTREYSSFDEFIDAAKARFQLLDPHITLTKEIISSHPRLGLPKGTELSEHSSIEQQSLQGDDTVKEFTKLNKEYEEKYPGLKFVLFVNGRDRTEVKKYFRLRINRGDYEQEVKDAIGAMCDIAKDRVKKLQTQNKL